MVISRWHQWELLTAWWQGEIPCKTVVGSKKYCNWIKFGSLRKLVELYYFGDFKSPSRVGLMVVLLHFLGHNFIIENPAHSSLLLHPWLKWALRTIQNAAGKVSLIFVIGGSFVEPKESKHYLSKTKLNLNPWIWKKQVGDYSGTVSLPIGESTNLLLMGLNHRFAVTTYMLCPP